MAGGLVGLQRGVLMITATYASAGDAVGSLVGRRGGGSIIDSHGFGEALCGESSRLNGSPRPPRVGAAARLTTANAGSAWDDASSNILGAWDFGAGL